MSKMPSPTPQDIGFKRLALACRRGNAETEQLLQAFLPKLPELTTAELKQFEQLLQQEEHTLFLWLMQLKQAPTTLQPLIAKIHSHYLTGPPD